MGRFTITATGDQGSGKTTALNLIEDALSAAGYTTRLGEGEHQIVVRSPGGNTQAKFDEIRSARLTAGMTIGRPKNDRRNPADVIWALEQQMGGLDTRMESIEDGEISMVAQVAEALDALKELRADLQQVVWRVGELERVSDEAGGEIQPDPLPATPLTEDAIVAALKADSGMAGRVMAKFAGLAWQADLLAVSTAARDEAGRLSGGAYGALQSLAVALAAASYRG